jgi:enoyl-CoA hydratase/carnithine racemase
MPEELSPWDGRIEPSQFEAYAEKYKDFFVMTRRNGIIEVRMHTNGGPFYHSWKGHNAWGQAWMDIGRDPENEVLIITGTGDWWHTGNPDDVWRAPFKDWTKDSQIKMYDDAVKLLENLIFCVEIPTIGAINGPGTHCEIGTLCDITLCTEDANFFDPHFMAGTVPGDGMALTLQQMMGFKQASYFAYTGQKITGQMALELGIVNEVLPRDRLLPRAWELAEMIMKRPRLERRLTHSVLSQPWKRALTNDLRLHMAHSFFALSLNEGESTKLLAEMRDNFINQSQEEGSDESAQPHGRRFGGFHRPR